MEAESAAEVSFELAELAELLEQRLVLIAAAGGEHAGEVADGGDVRPKALADGLAGGGAAQIVITAAGTRGLRDDLQSPAGGSQLEQVVLAQILVKRERFAARHAGVELVECERETAQVGGLQRGREVEPVGQLVCPLDDAREAADQDVGNSLALEGAQ